ncbi:Hypothetical protein A7982_08361 [Minicystis rosea]|nr:Hypothetical protein A7982_08361 [Minicystis rosea]
MPPRLIVDGKVPSEDWRRALDDLTAAVTEEGHMWSCAGGELRLELDPDHERATLTRRDPRGREATRHVSTPAELLPTAEALLAFSWNEAPPSHAEPPAPAEPESPRAHGPMEPRLIAAALIGARYSGALRSLWGTATLRAAVPLDAWSVGAWGRFGVPYVFDRAPHHFSMSDLALGLSVGRRIVATRWLDVQATFDPSIAFVSMEAGHKEDEVEGAKLDGRLGLGLRATILFSRRWRGVVAIDGEIAPASAVRARRIDAALPPLPVGSAGLSFGVDMAIR